MPNWYILIDNQPVGPYSDDTLRRQITEGNLLSHDMLWHEGMAQWTPAGSIPDLFSDTPQSPYAPADPNIAAATALVGAGFWKRLAAFLIDQILLGLSLGFFLVFIGHRVKDPFQFDPIANTLSLLIGWLYYAFMESGPRQATLGKIILGIIVTDLQGNRVTFARASGRFFGKILSTFTFLIGYLMAGFTARKQALHDMLAGCLVINRL